MVITENIRSPVSSSAGGKSALAECLTGSRHICVNQFLGTRETNHFASKIMKHVNSSQAMHPKN